MTADLLRRAAAKMRENAQAADPDHPWYTDDELPQQSIEDARHIAAWTPAAATAVADLIECPCHGHALTVARTFLGEPA